MLHHGAAGSRRAEQSLVCQIPENHRGRTAEPEEWEEVTFKKIPGPDGVTVTPMHPKMDSVKIYYTLDGTNPTVHSNVYNISATYYQPQLNKPILLTEDAEIRAVAVGAGKYDSPVSSTAVAFGSARFTDMDDYAWASLPWKIWLSRVLSAAWEDPACSGRTADKSTVCHHDGACIRR